MAIDPSSLLLRLNPVRPISLAPLQQLAGAGGGSSLERERLRLMREQFEESRRQHREQEALSKLEEAGRTTRAKMQAEAEAEALRQKQRAELMQRRQEGIAKFGELNASGDIEGARAMVPFLTSLGADIELEGEEAGLPRYRVDADPEATAAAASQKAMDGGDIAPEESIGYPADDSGALDEPAGIPSTEDAFRRAQHASLYSLASGMPARPAPVPDYTGSVPKNVIDVGAMQAQTLARLNPALSGLIGAYPEPYRESAAKTADATRAMGLPAVKGVEQFHKLRGGPDSLISSEIEAGAQQKRFEQTQQVAASKERSDQYDRGFSKMGKEIAGKFGIEDLPQAQQQTERAINILTNDVDSDDSLVYALISRRMGERGATTEGDIRRATGMEAQAWLDQVKSWLEKGLEGGLPLAQKNGIIGVLREMQKSNQQRYVTYLDSIEDLAEGSSDPEVARGLRDYARVTVPKDVRERLAKERGEKTAKSDDATTGASPIPDTARIAQVHNNPGNLKFADQAGATKGEAASDGGSWAKFKTYEEGLAALRKQIEKDAGRGLTVREFVTKYAPPGSNDTEKYVADAMAALGVSDDAKMSDIDIDKAVAFVAKKESGTEVGKAPAAEGAEAEANAILERAGY